MKGLLATFFLFVFLLPASFVIETVGAPAAQDGLGVYIVYMGAAVPENGSVKNNQNLVRTTVLKWRKNAMVRNYRHGFSGFAARMTAKEAQSIAQKPGVVSVFPDRVLQLHTTRSWDFLKYPDVLIDSNPNSDTGSSSQGSDTIIGVIDTGIWPEAESFNDKEMGPIPSRWKGICETGQNFNSSNCNRKLIGARFYSGGDDDDDDEENNTPRDEIGHGTHVASTAAGAAVSGASYYGLASGTARGGSPGSRIAVYRVCSPAGCRSSGILAAFDDAIADGVDVISVSLGSSSIFMIDIKEDTIAIGAFHAVENGITVVCSAGNDGPDPETVVNAAPWILTVGATTIDRNFESDVVLGGNKTIKGEAINFANLKSSPVNPLIDAKSAKKTGASENDARNCKLDTLDENLVKGKIVFCESTDASYSTIEKKEEVQSAGGIGVVVVNEETSAHMRIYKDFAVTMISSKDASEIMSYINSSKNPVATILPTVSKTNYKPAPTVAYFSSRGPSALLKNILKPDIVGPGVNILAAWMGNDTAQAPEGKEAPLFNMISGTSMSCPHVSGMAAMVKSRNPTFGPSAVKSAIMTTASTIDNLKGRMTTDSGDIATPYDYGAGELSTSASLQPGLVFETTTVDYLNFLCYYGYNITTIKLISKDIPEGFTCPKDSTRDLISNINYPSMAVTNLVVNQTKSIVRTVTNVGEDEVSASYTVKIEIDGELGVGVKPDTLQFSKKGEKKSYSVEFIAVKPATTVFGAITWSNGKVKVRSPFVAIST